MATDPPASPLKHLRDELDRTDEEIVRLVARRLETVGAIMKAKADLPGAIRNPAREREVLAKVEAAAQSLGLPGPLARKIFSEIIAHSVTIQAAGLSGREAGGREISVALQGFPHTYDHLAAEKYLAGVGAKGRYVSGGSIAGAVAKVASGEAEIAFLPIENTFGGSINQVYDILREQDLHLVGEETFKIDHCLAAPGDVPVEAIDRVLSHPLVLDQCSSFLATFPAVRPVACRDTAEAVALVAEARDPRQAAIAAAEAAEAAGLFILRHGIGNQPEILNRFVALARTPAHVDRRVPCKTSLILATRHEHGALMRCLQILADYGLSLTKLESRPRPNRPWEYMFFLDFDGHIEDPQVAAALDALRARALFLKVLGCYPAKATPTDAWAAEIDVGRTPAAPSTDVPVSAAVVTEHAAAGDSGVVSAAAPALKLPASKHYRLADRATRAEDTVIRVGDLLIGGGGFIVMAGPCSVESPEQIDATAKYVKEHGAHVLRGGVFKPRTSPYAFQGLGYDGLELLANAGRRWGMPIITEVMAPDQVRPVAQRADILQIGARNMQNFSLLKEVGRVDRPVLLKRGLSSTIDEWLAAAEYILAQGNGQVILCERGIRTFESATRNTLDLSAVVVLRERTHLPVVVDPSHGTGKRSYVAPMAWAARACGAHGILVEVHPDPDHALSDGDQSLTLPAFASLMDGLGRVRPGA